MSEFWDNIWNYISIHIIGVLREMRFTDVIDILLLALVLFSVFRFIKERRAGKLAIGLAVIALVYIVSTLFNLRTMKYILQHFYQVGLISIIIIFQSDLRAALEKVGNTPIRSLHKNITDSEHKEIEKMTETLAKVCDTLSRSKTGALLVIEQNTKLGDYLSQGEIVNADISELLLRNLFFNKAPLHDGAVILRNRRVFAAGCYLPLSNADINRDLGTRHRAAIGLSEQSDAIVIVVSEETGTISIAHEGKLTTNYNYTSLKQTLLSYLAPVSAEKKQKTKRKEKSRS